MTIYVLMSGAVAGSFLVMLAGVGWAAPELPRVFIDTTLPSVTGTTFIVNCPASPCAVADLQNKINTAALADPNLNHQIVVQAGATFNGALIIPTRADGTGWIIIRSSAEASLPAPGTRVAPANAINMPRIQAPGDTPGNPTPVIQILGHVSGASSVSKCRSQTASPNNPSST